MQPIILFGSGSPIIVDVQESCRRLGLAVTVIKNVEGTDYAIGAKIIRVSEAEPGFFDQRIAVPIFTPAHRQRASEEARALGASDFLPLLDPTAILPESAEIGEGVYVNSGVTIGAASRLGRFSLVNRAATLGHHLALGDFASIGPGAVICGQVSIGRGSMVGAGAVVMPGLRIGDNSVIAAGAVVSRDLPSNVLAAGNPARIVKRDIRGYNGHGVAPDVI